jgi:ferritin-like metal-binding protein YciE
MTTKAAPEKKAQKAEKTLNDLFLCELADMYDAEKRIVKALPKLAKAAMTDRLKKAINLHLKETEGHVKTIELVFATCDAKPKGKKCEAVEGLLAESDEIVAEFKGTQACDAAIISACQKVEHYEIASYGCLREWAGLLGNSKAVEMLDEILEQEAASNETLTEIARATSNDTALDEEEREVAPEANGNSKSRRR